MSTVDQLFSEVLKLRKEVRRLRRQHQPTNEEEVQELVGNSGEGNSQRQSGRHTGGGFAAAAKEVIKKSDKARQEVRRRPGLGQSEIHGCRVAGPCQENSHSEPLGQGFEA